MKIARLLCLTAALLTSSLMGADEAPKKIDPAAGTKPAHLSLEATKASVRRKLIEQIQNLERRIEQAEGNLNSRLPMTVIGSAKYDDPKVKQIEVCKDIVLTSQAQLIQALAELAKICD